MYVAFVKNLIYQVLCLKLTNYTNKNFIITTVCYCKKIGFVFCYTPFFTIPLSIYVSQITTKSQFHHLRLA